MKEELISVIVPVYNSEAYLEECIDSLINQVYSNIEIILVNDGSTDNSEDICIKYKNRDSRIKYFKQQNAGAAAARNVGINYATGKYIGFVDSDDYVDNDMYKTLYMALIENRAQAAQILSRRFTNDGIVVNQSLIDETNGKPNEIYNSDDAVKRYLIGNHSLCTHLYEAGLFENIKLPENMSGEDLAIIIPLYSRIEKTVKINSYKYNYRLNLNSVTNSGLNQRSINLYYEYKKQLKLYESNELYEELLIYTKFKTLNGIINEMVLYGDCGFDNNEKFFRNELKCSFEQFEQNSFVSSAQIKKLNLYLYCRSIYKILLQIKRKNYKRPLYGEE
ncbi:MAG: glycosyltransferase family 2 protein [Erysipelotrichia bacterium]|nr:glycosyltransferase family 2 protein [Erysipelotrichia bacterium]